MTARTEYTTAILQLVNAGTPPPCVDRRVDWWVSDIPADQTRAATECATACKMLDTCKAYVLANPEIAGVYGALTALARNPARPHRPTKES
jgi:hypothetical protein